jgi:hypothetical protein
MALSAESKSGFAVINSANTSVYAYWMQLGETDLLQHSIEWVW